MDAFPVMIPFTMTEFDLDHTTTTMTEAEIESETGGHLLEKHPEAPEELNKEEPKLPGHEHQSLIDPVPHDPIPTVEESPVVDTTWFPLHESRGDILALGRTKTVETLDVTEDATAATETSSLPTPPPGMDGTGATETDSFWPPQWSVHDDFLYDSPVYRDMFKCFKACHESAINDTLKNQTAPPPIPKSYFEQFIRVAPEYSLTQSLVPQPTATGSSRYQNEWQKDYNKSGVVDHIPWYELSNPYNTYHGRFNESHTSRLALRHPPSANPTPWFIVLASVILSLSLGCIAHRSNRPDWQVPIEFIMRITKWKSFAARKEYREGRRRQRRLDKDRTKAAREASSFGLRLLFDPNKNEQENRVDENDRAEAGTAEDAVQEPSRVYSPTSGQVDQGNLISFTSLAPPAPGEKPSGGSGDGNEDIISDNDPVSSAQESVNESVKNRKFFFRASLALLALTWRTVWTLAGLIYCCTKKYDHRGPHAPPSSIFVLIVAIQLGLSNHYIPQIFTLGFMLNLLVASVAFIISTVFTMDYYARPQILGGNCPEFLRHCEGTHYSWNQVGCGAKFPIHVKNATASRYHLIQRYSSGRDMDLFINGEDPENGRFNSDFPYNGLHGFENVVVILGSAWLFTVLLCAYMCSDLLLFRFKFRELYSKPLKIKNKGPLKWSALRGVTVLGCVLALMIGAMSTVLHGMHETQGGGAWFVDSKGPVVNVTDPAAGGESWSDCFWVETPPWRHEDLFIHWLQIGGMVGCMRLLAMV